MRPAFILLPLMALAACATPREQCLANATRDTRVLTLLVNETRANIARGYGLEERQELRSTTGTCRGRNEDGSTFFFTCEETETLTTTVPVALDLNAERAKLRSLEEQLANRQATSTQAVNHCIAAYPE